MLDTLRFLSGLAWFICFVFMAGSMYRFIVKRMRFQDREWIVCWFFAMLQTGYFVRFIAGLAPSHDPGLPYSVTTGLQVLSLLIALRVLHLRVDHQGWRW